MKIPPSYSKKRNQNVAKQLDDIDLNAAVIEFHKLIPSVEDALGMPLEPGAFFVGVLTALALAGNAGLPETAIARRSAAVKEGVTEIRRLALEA